jgi:serine/threonine-protein kinase
MTDPTSRLNAALEGRYRIERELGEGGMATVYLADDLKHERKVAVKVLKPELAAVVGAERFLAEIKTTANLQHPHILPLHDSGEADGFLYYVMPFIEGESLRDRLDRERQLPVDEAVRIAADVAEALHAAHVKGVIHRDIKPANILLSGGRPLVADFGIALAVSAAGGGRLTETGLSLGTPHYMSPEQATGDQTVGPTADVYALGCVLYEMLAGEPPYTGGSAQAILGKIISEPPPEVTRQRKSVPRNVEGAILKALEKVPADRFATAQDLQRGLGDPSFGAAGAAPASVPRGRRVSAALAGALAVMTALAFWGWSRGSGEAGPYRIVALDLSEVPNATDVALSPDGSRIAVASGRRLWVRDLGQASFREMPNTEGALAVTWSPDSEWVAFGVRDEIRKIHWSGESASVVIKMSEACGGRMVCGPSWTDDGRIIATGGYSDVLVASENGGPAVPLLERGEEHFHRPVALPGGAVLLNVDRDVGETGWDLWDGESRQAAPIPSRRSAPSYANNRVFYDDGRDIWAREYSERDRAFVGEPLFVASGLQLLGAGEDGSLLAWRTGSFEGRGRELMWINRNGDDLEPAATLPEAVGRVSRPVRSNNGLLAYLDGSQIWILDAAGAGRRPVPLADGEQDWPMWGPDGRTLYYTERQPGVSGWLASIKRFDLESGETSDLAATGQQLSVSADGRYLGYTVGDIGSRSLHYLDLTRPGSTPEAFDHGFDDEAGLSFSPTHDVVAFVARDLSGGTPALWLSRFPDGGDMVLVTPDVDSFGGVPRWSADGRHLYYFQDFRLTEVAVQVDAATMSVVNEPVELFLVSDFGISGRDIAVGPDPSRFLVGGRGDLGFQPELPDRLVLIQNWRPGR